MPVVRLVRSEELRMGDVLPALHGGVELVVWRAVDGVARVHEARCPHQWNHLGAVGGVAGAELVCTAHFWRFDAAGTGTRLLSDGTREPTRDVRAYRTVEQDGWITVDLAV